MAKFLKRYGLAILCGVLALAILTLGLSLFAIRARRMVSQVSEGFVEEKALKTADSYSFIIENHITMLNDSAELFNGVNLKNKDSVSRVLSLMKGVGMFKVVGAFMNDGSGIDSDGNIFGSFSDKPEYLKPMQGMAYVSDMTEGLDGSTQVMLVCVPVYRGGEPQAVLFGVLDRETLASVIQDKAVSSSGERFLLTRDGVIVASSDPNVGEIPGNDGYFNTLTYWKNGDSRVIYVRDRMFDVDKLVVYRYSIDGEGKCTIITPIDKCPLVLAVVLPESILKERTRVMGLYIALLVLSVVIAVGLLLFALVTLARSDSEIVRRYEKYEIASRQSKTLVFDYDHIRKRLELSGNYDMLTGKKGSVFENGNERFIFDLVHDDDQAVKELFMNLHRNKEARINAEARLLCADGIYRWFRIRATVLRSQEGAVREIVGNLANVEEKARDIGTLKFKEEIDEVTGLYNKSSFEALVADKLSNPGSGSMYALYVIDIDNFGSVNDILGHVIGDRILSTVAGKIGRVFTDKDCIGRLKGDKFGVLLLLAPETKRVGQRIIEDKAYRLCKTMDETYSDGENDVRVSVSVGVSCYPDDGNTYEELFRRADAALYAAKHSGKNQCCIYRNGGVDA